MNKSFPVFKKYLWSFVAIVFSLVLLFSAVDSVSANDWTFTDSFKSHKLGDLNGQDGWAVTNYYGNSNNAANVSVEDPDAGTKNVEITNSDSLIATRDITPINAGIFQLRMRHNKSGLFYFYALTSDAGGQLLFSIQFTESNGILLEEANEQVTLLPDYNANQWYLFTIDFDKTRGEKGTFKVKIDDGSYSEYPYVNSESAVFDFAQMVFGSDSEGGAVSAFGDIKSIPILPVLTVDINNTATPSVTTVNIDGTSVVTTPDTAPAMNTETINNNSLANVISATFDTVSTISKDSPIDTGTKNQTDIIISGTNAASITTVQETQSADPSISVGTDSSQIITAPF